jgi:hypothetical protein
VPWARCVVTRFEARKWTTSSTLSTDAYSTLNKQCWTKADGDPPPAVVEA